MLPSWHGCRCAGGTCDTHTQLDFTCMVDGSRVCCRTCVLLACALPADVATFLALDLAPRTCLWLCLSIEWLRWALHLCDHNALITLPQ